jgi:SAM-dependent methyltransferase
MNDSLASVTDKHRRLVVEQFTKQAVPFSQIPAASDDLLLRATGVGPEDIVLDVACGPGLTGCLFAGVARHVTGVDVTPAMIRQAEALQSSKGMRNVTWRVAAVPPLPFDDASFSLVFTRYSFHHFPDPAAVLAEMVRVCRPGGRVSVADTFTTSPEQGRAFNRLERLRDPSHVRALPLEELLALPASVGLTDRRSFFYRHEFEFERLMAGSFPNPGDDQRVRDMLNDDIGSGRLGLARRDGASVRFAYPVAIVTASKPQ